MKIKTIISTILAVSFLGACTVEKTYVTPTTEAPSYNEPDDNSIENMTSAEKDEFFISYLYTQPEVSWMITQNGEAWMLDLGHLICDAIDEGMTLNELASMTLVAGADPTAVGIVAGSAITLFCPENSWFLDQAGA